MAEALLATAAIRRLAAWTVKEVDFGPAMGFDLSATEWFHAWDRLMAAWTEMEQASDGPNRRAFARELGWWNQLVQHLEAEIAADEAELAEWDAVGEWHRPVDEVLEFGRLKLEASLDVRADIEARLRGLYGVE